jgi:hypothetical protein
VQAGAGAGVTGGLGAGGAGGLGAGGAGGFGAGAGGGGAWTVAATDVLGGRGTVVRGRGVVIGGCDGLVAAVGVGAADVAGGSVITVESLGSATAVEVDADPVPVDDPGRAIAATGVATTTTATTTASHGFRLAQAQSLLSVSRTASSVPESLQRATRRSHQQTNS